MADAKKRNFTPFVFSAFQISVSMIQWKVQKDMSRLNHHRKFFK